MRSAPDPRSGRPDAGDPRVEVAAWQSEHAVARVPGAVAAVRAATGLVPRVAIVLGSGLGGVAKAIDTSHGGAALATAELPHWPTSTVPGHAGRLVLGHWHGVPVAALSGRSHRYEGYGPDRVTFAIRVLAALEARVLFLTNAVGSTNPLIPPGSLMLVRDHLNFHGTRGLLSPRELGTAKRSTPVYSSRWIEILRGVALEARVPLAEGVLLGGLGPAYETASEVAAARRWGADAVCMSTVTEALVGAALGLEVAAISCVTNLATGLSDRALTHEEVTEVADNVASNLATLLGETVKRA